MGAAVTESGAVGGAAEARAGATVTEAGAAGGRDGSVEGWRRVQTVRQERQSEEGDSRTREGLKGPPVGAN